MCVCVSSDEETPVSLDTPPSALNVCQEEEMDNITMDDYPSLPVIEEGS